MMRTLLIVTALIGFVAVVSVESGAIRAGVCSISVTGGLGDPPPLILKGGTAQFVRAADTKGTVAFGANEEITLACPGNGNYLTVREDSSGN